MAKASPRVKRELSLLQLHRLANNLRAITPGDWWHQHCTAAIHEGRSTHPGRKPKKAKYRDDVDEQADNLARAGIFPPEADNRCATMKPCQCRDCAGRRMFPAAYLSTITYGGRRMRVSFDCWLRISNQRRERSRKMQGDNHIELPTRSLATPHAMTEDAAERRGISISKIRLAPESEEALLREIAKSERHIEVKANGHPKEAVGVPIVVDFRNGNAVTSPRAPSL